MSSHAVARLEKVDERIRSPLLGCLRIRYSFYRFTLLNSSQYYDVLTVRLGVFVLFNGLIISKIIHRGVIKYEAHIQNLGTFMVLCAKFDTFGQIYTHKKNIRSDALQFIKSCSLTCIR